MATHKAWIKLKFYVELPDDDNEADSAFDEVTEWIVERLNNGTLKRSLVSNTPGAIFVQSFGIEDADTQPEKLA